MLSKNDSPDLIRNSLAFTGCFGSYNSYSCVRYYCIFNYHKRLIVYYVPGVRGGKIVPWGPQWF